MLYALILVIATCIDPGTCIYYIRILHLSLSLSLSLSLYIYIYIYIYTHTHTHYTPHNVRLAASLF